VAKLAIFAVILLSSRLPPGFPPGWKETTTKDGLFRFAMPAPPEERDVTMKTGRGDVPFHVYQCTVNECLYGWSRSRHPEPPAPKDREVYIAGYIQGMAMRGKLLSQKRVVRDGHSGWIVKIDGHDKPDSPALKISILIFLVEDEMIEARVIPLRPGGEPKDVDPFFESVHLPRMNK
jgi:hypothetical protein